MPDPFSNTIKQPFLQTIEDPVFIARSLKVQVLRMDVLHPVISGNKWMKLQPWIELAKQNGNGAIVTKGGPWSNHVHAAAFAAQSEGLLFTAIIKGKEEMCTPMLEDALKWGVKLIYVDDKDYKNDAKWIKLASSANQLYVPMGGEGEVAAEGVSQYINNLNLPAFDHIICPIGTGTTFRGIAASNISYTKMTAINPGINDPSYEQMLLELREKYPAKNFSIIENKQLKKFGKWPPELVTKMNDWYQQWQLPTDIIYTAKMFFIFTELVKNEYFEKEESILLIHTGGLQGNRSLRQGLLNF
ncbi:pyridoxal-phosphate dependent enzyme [soil metagenome]